MEGGLVRWARGALALLAAMLVMNGPRAARAEWPMPRHDPQRTGASDGASNITEPAIYWQHFLGGAFTGRSVIVMDVDGDDVGEVVVVSPGTVSARRAETNDPIWTRAILDLEEIVGVDDLDGNGGAELVVRSSSQVFVLRPADGEILWEEPAGEMGTIVAVRLADLDGDGSPELVVQDCYCCTLASPSGTTGVVYRFRGPGADISSPVLLWTTPWASCGGARSLTVARMDTAAAGAQLLLSNEDDTALALLDGSSGSVVAANSTLGMAPQLFECLPADVGWDEGEELLCIYSAPVGPPGHGRRLVLLRFDSSPTPALVTAWQTSIGDVDGAAFLPPSPIGDLDDDGSIEVVAGGKSHADQWLTLVVDAQTGQVTETLTGYRAAGLAPTGAGGSLMLLAVADDTLHAFGRDDAGNGLGELFALDQRAPVADVDYDVAARSYLHGRRIAVDVDGDGSDELITVDADAAADLSAHRTTGAEPELLARYVLEPTVAVVGALDVAAPNGLGQRVAVAQSDGNLHVLDPYLEPLSGRPGYGVRLGGFFAPGTRRKLLRTPIAADLDGNGSDALLVPTSRRTLDRVDASQATRAVGPRVLWSRPHTTGATVPPTWDEGPRPIAAIDDRDSTAHNLVLLSPDAVRRWQAPLSGIVLTDLMWGSLDGDDQPDLMVQWGSPYDLVERHRAFAGASGATLWAGEAYSNDNRQPSGMASADWNDDGVDDLVLQSAGTHVLDGRTGQALASSATGPVYALPTLVDVDGDSTQEIVLHASTTPLRVLEHDPAVLSWQSSDDDKPLDYGATARCEDRGPVLISPSVQHPARLKISNLGGAAAGTFTTRVAAGGQLFDDEQQAEQQGVPLGRLASPTVHGNLAGDSQPVALVGSTDGWIYAIDPCTVSLRFAIPIGVPVGAVVYGDTDGDGLDEILASAADGYLYGLKQPPVAPVDWVIDTDPARGIVDQDVDEIITIDQLHAAWTPVPDADGYEIAVVHHETAGDGYVTDPPWMGVAAGVTSTTLSGLPLIDQTRYRVAVRATRGGHPSPDVLSDGVLVRLGSGGGGGAGGEPPSPPEPPPAEEALPLLTGRSCVYFCTIRPTSGFADGLAPWAFLLLVGWSRRRRRQTTIGS